jgi:hypothetical protein
MRIPLLVASSTLFTLAAEDLLHDFQLSLNVMAAAGASTANDALLADLQGGAHDPARRGFTFQQAELALTGAVDPYFRLESYLVFTPEVGVELEEAFAQSTALPAGLLVEGGYFLTEFGRANPRHPHSSAWLDRPVAWTRILSGDGLRGAGARVEWRIPTPWLSSFHVGAQNADDDTMISFRGEDHHMAKVRKKVKPFLADGNRMRI